MVTEEVTDTDIEALFDLARWTAFGIVFLERVADAAAVDRWQAITEDHAVQFIQAIQNGSERPETMPYSRVLLGALDPRFAEERHDVP